jgi:sphingolipid delta-4 desaturase
MAPRDNFHFSPSEEPHAQRRKEILAKHPEIQELFEPDIRPVPYVVAIIFSQIAIAYLQQKFQWSWGLFLAVCWVYGGGASHALSLMTHELSHNLVFKTPRFNDYFGIFCNVGMGFPSSTMFKRYHMEHHRFQGDPSVDADLPTALEGNFFSGIILKAMWVFLMPLAYSCRPQHVRPKKHRGLDNLNVAVLLCTNALVAYTCGIRGLLYLTLSTVLGMGFHPCAGHFIAEHFVFVEGHETYSYYGSLNLFCWNVGYHNEHHDFPRVPGWRLPQIKFIAPEFYENLPSHASWSMVIWNFITQPQMSPFSRMLRTLKDANDAPAVEVAEDLAAEKKKI